MKRDRVCIATVTWARTEDEERTIRRALDVLARLPFPTFVCDRPERPGVRDFLASSDELNTVEPDGPGLLGQVRASLRAAAEMKPDFILYTEPDKEDFFANGLLDFSHEASEQRDAGVVFAARSAESFVTFPSMQRYTEGVINHLWERLGGPRGDYSYGPMLLRTDLVRLVETLRVDLGWGWRHLVGGGALFYPRGILHRVGNYPCPLDQRDEDDLDRMHRISQLAENIRGLLYARGISMSASPRGLNEDPHSRAD